MLFRSTYQSRQLLPGGIGGLADMLGVPLSDLTLTEGTSIKEITCFTCIKILSESVAKLPVKIYQNDGYGAQKPVSDYRHQLLKLLANSYMSAYDFGRSVETRRDA